MFFWAGEVGRLGVGEGEGSGGCGAGLDGGDGASIGSRLGSRCSWCLTFYLSIEFGMVG